MFDYGNFGYLGLVEYYLANLPLNEWTLAVVADMLNVFIDLGWESDARTWENFLL